MRQWEKTIKVYCSTCKQEFNEKTVTFLNIEENMQGQDVLTFLCPVCEQPVKSLRRG